MRIGMMMDYTGGFQESVELLQDYEAAGLEAVAVGEAYSFDSVSQLGYIAARTSSVQLLSGIFQVYSRTPSLLAMTAAGLDYVSGGRFEMGIGASGPQVVEGWHGLKYDAPLGRMREVIEICRRIWRREVIEFEGRHYHLPLTEEQGGTGLGKPLKLINHPVRERIPISVAALGEKSVEQTAELAEGWQPLFFHPGKAQLAFGESLDRGLARRSPELGTLDIQLQVTFAVGEPDPASVGKVRDQLALYIGGMGARDKNFYNELARRYGYVDEAREIQDLYLTGQKAEAARLVPEDLVRAVSLLGDEEDIARQVKEFEAAGVSTLLLNPVAATPEQRVKDVATLHGLLGS